MGEAGDAILRLRDFCRGAILRPGGWRGAGFRRGEFWREI